MHVCSHMHACSLFSRIISYNLFLKIRIYWKVVILCSEKQYAVICNAIIFYYTVFLLYNLLVALFYTFCSSNLRKVCKKRQKIINPFIQVCWNILLVYILNIWRFIIEIYVLLFDSYYFNVGILRWLLFLLKGNKPSSRFVGRNIMKLLSINII
mgnify:CR=1 FL=1